MMISTQEIARGGLSSTGVEIIMGADSTGSPILSRERVTIRWM